MSFPSLLQYEHADRAQWSNNPSGTTNYSAEFNFTDAQTSISLNSQPSASFWLRLFATTTDSIPRVVTYLEAPITVYDGPISPSYIQPSWYFGVFTDVNGNLISPPISGPKTKPASPPP